MIESRHWPAFEGLFAVYLSNLLRRRFAALHVRGNVPETKDPLIVACQHVAFWDSLVLFHLSRVWTPPARYDAMMDEKNLVEHKFLRWIGAFGIDRSSKKGSLAALRHSMELLKTPNLRLLMFPQGKQESMDKRPLTPSAGASWLAVKSKVGFFPVALRYEFIEHEKPEIFVSIGAVRKAEKSDEDPVVAAITSEADGLRDAVHARDTSSFTTLFSQLKPDPTPRLVAANESDAQADE